MRYRVVPLEQGTDRWLRWRREGIGASEAAAVLGCSPFTTRERLLVEKTAGGVTAEVFSPARTFAMRRGQRLEPVARAAYVRRTGRRVAPICLESVDRAWLRASLDGWDEERTRPLEIKCPGLRAHAEALAGRVPPHYYAQLQHILAVTGCGAIDYFSYREDSQVLLTIHRDEGYIERLLEAESTFWREVERLRRRRAQAP